MPTILTPALTMRKDGNRVILYPGHDNQVFKKYEFAFRIIDPRAAVVLSLFDGTNSKSDVIQLWTELNECEESAARAHVDQIVAELGEYLVDVDTLPVDYKPLNPEDFVVNMAALDYSTDRLNAPYSMLFLPTLLCSHNCRYCYADIRKTADSNELTTKEIEQILDQTVQLRFSDVSLSGGDPFLRKDIIEIIDMLFSRGYTSDVPTKSALSAGQIERLRSIGVSRIQISLDSPLDGAAVEYLTGRPGYFESIMDTLMRLGDAGFKVGITAVVTKYTIDSVPEIAEFYARLGFISRVSFSTVAPSIYRTFHDLYPPFEQYEAVTPRMDEIKNKYTHLFIKWDPLKDPAAMTDEERRQFFEKRPVCSGGKFAFVLLPDGKVTLCEELYYHPNFIVGDLRKQSITEMWHSPEILRILQPDRENFVGSPCHDCPTFYECHAGCGRCWKRALQGYREKSNPEWWPDPYCPRAPKPIERMF